MNLSSFIDHTILKPETTLADIEKLCREAREYGFATVCIPPYFVKEAVRQLAGTGVKVTTVIGFPFGYQHCSAKGAEAAQAIADGAEELDVVMNIAAFKNQDEAPLEKEITQILKLSSPEAIILKVIIESGLLTDEEIVRCCRFYQQFEIDFLKTSTGYAPTGATTHAVKLMRAHLPDTIQIKASGGIRTYDFARELVAAGATRLGCSASVAIVKGEPASDKGY